MEEVAGEDSDIRSYVILREDGTEILQNKRYLRLTVGPLEYADSTTEPYETKHTEPDIKRFLFTEREHDT